MKIELRAARADAVVARRAHAAVGLDDVADAGVLPAQALQELHGAVGGAVDHHHQLEVGEGLAEHRVHGAAEPVGAIVGRDDDRDARHAG